MSGKWRLTCALAVLAAFGMTGAFKVSAEETAGHAGRQLRPLAAYAPSSLREEHTELHERLERLTKLGGRTGMAAQEVKRLLDPHFVKEEQLAMPQLGLLAGLAAGRMPLNAGDAVRLSEKLEAELPRMLDEHKDIVAALQVLRAAARDEKKPEAIRFADALAAHAKMEEQVLYPAAILVGKYVRIQQR